MSKITPMIRGNPWDSQDFESSVPVEKELIYTQIIGAYTAKDKKLWPLLIHHAWREDGLNSEVYQVPISQVTKLFRELGGSAYGSWIEKSADRLVGSRLRWRQETLDAKYHGIVSLLSQAVVKTDKDSGLQTLFYGLPSTLRDLMKDQELFGRIRTQFLISLRSKYAISLYEVLTTIINLRNPEKVVTVKTLRSWLQISDGKLERWAHLHSRALKPAIDELNERSEQSGFVIDYEIQHGAKRKVLGVLFKTEKTKEFLEKEELLLKRTPKISQTTASNSAEARLKDNVRKSVLKARTLYTQAEAMATAYNRDVSKLLDEWIEWGSRKEGWPPKQPGKAFLGFVEKKGPV